MSDLEILISDGEGSRLEFKKTINRPEKIARTLVSFANTTGGIILVGVHDNGTLAGIDPEEEKHTLLKAAQLFCKPPVRLFFKEIEIKEENIIILKAIIPKSASKPHLAKIKEDDWRSFIRINDQSIQSDEKH